MSTCTDTDKAHLARAIELARKGLGAVKPNPVVGAVVARDGEILGEGWHEEFGGPHAEVNAIEACGLEDLSGATLYVSLEPCCHEGKTPPCTEAILQAGIRRAWSSPRTIPRRRPPVAAWASCATRASR